MTDDMFKKKAIHAIKQTEADLDETRTIEPTIGDPPIDWDRQSWFGSKQGILGGGGGTLTDLKGDYLQLKHNTTPAGTVLDANYGTFYLDNDWKLKKNKGTGAAVEAIESLSDVGDIKTLTQTTGYLKKVNGVWELDTTVTSSTYNDDSVKALLKMLSKPFWDGLDNLKSIVGDAVKAAKDALQAAIDTLTGYFNAIGKTVAEVWGKLVAHVTWLATEIGTVATNVWNSLTSGANWLRDVVWEGFTDTVTWLKSNIWDTTKAILKSFWDWLFETNVTVPNDSDTPADPSKPNDGNEFQWIKSIRNFIRSITKAYQNAVTFALDVGKKIISAILGNVTEALNAGLGFASEFWNWLFKLEGSNRVNWRLNKSQNESAEVFWLRTLREWLKPVFTSLKTGIDAAWEIIKNAGTSVWNWILGLGKPSSTTDEGNRNWLKILHDALKSIGKTVTGLWNVVKQFWASIVANNAWLKQIQDLMSNTAKQIQDALKGATSTLKTALITLRDKLGEGLGALFGIPAPNGGTSPNTGATTGDIDVKTFDLRRVDRIFFESNDPYTRTTLSKPIISGQQDGLYFAVPQGKPINFIVGGQTFMRLQSNVNKTPRNIAFSEPLVAANQIKVGTFDSSDTSSTKTTNGVFWLDGTNIKCYTGGKEVDLGAGGSATTWSGGEVTGDVYPDNNYDESGGRDLGKSNKRWDNVYTHFITSLSLGTANEARFSIKETGSRQEVAYPGQNNIGVSSDVFILNKNGTLTARHRKKNSSGAWINGYFDVSLEQSGGSGGGGGGNIPTRRSRIPILVNSNPSSSQLNSAFGSTVGSVGIVLSASRPSRANQATLRLRATNGWRTITIGSTFGTSNNNRNVSIPRVQVMRLGTVDRTINIDITKLNDVKSNLAGSAADGLLGLYEASSAPGWFCVYSSRLQYPPYVSPVSSTSGTIGWSRGTQTQQMPISDLPNTNASTLDQYFGTENGSLGMDIDTLYFKAGNRWFGLGLTYAGTRPATGGGTFNGGDVPNPTTFKSLVTFEGGVSGISAGSNTPKYTPVVPNTVTGITGTDVVLFNNNGTLSVKKASGSPISLEAAAGSIGNITADIDMRQYDLKNVDTAFFNANKAIPTTSTTPFVHGNANALVFGTGTQDINFLFTHGDDILVRLQNVSRTLYKFESNVPIQSYKQIKVGTYQAVQGVTDNINGIMYLNGNDVIVRSGGKNVNLTNLTTTPGSGNTPDPGPGTPVTTPTLTKIATISDGTTPNGTRLDSVFGNKPGAIGMSGDNRTAASSTLWLRLSNQWIGLTARTHVSTSGTLNSSSTTKATVGYSTYTSANTNVQPSKDTIKGGDSDADTHGRLWLHENTTRTGGGGRNWRGTFNMFIGSGTWAGRVFRRNLTDFTSGATTTSQTRTSGNGTLVDIPMTYLGISSFPSYAAMLGLGGSDPGSIIGVITNVQRYICVRGRRDWYLFEMRF